MLNFHVDSFGHYSTVVERSDDATKRYTRPILHAPEDAAVGIESTFSARVSSYFATELVFESSFSSTDCLKPNILTANR